MKVWCQVLTTPASDSPGTCLLLHFDNKRYLIGRIGEGSQRSFTERQARLMKVTDIFLSGRTEWGNTGGLVGLLLTMGGKEEARMMDMINAPSKAFKAPVESKGMTVHGGQNLMHTLATTRAFVFRKAMKLKISEIPEQLRPEEPMSAGSPYFMDENLVARPMHIHPNGYQRAEAKVVSQGEPSLVGGTSSTGGESRRKRSFEDFSEKQKSREAVLRGVVEDMFCSDWTMDTMIEDSVDAPARRPVNENDMMMDSTSRSPSPSKRPRSLSSAGSTIAATPTSHDPQLSTRLPPPGKTRAPWPASTVRQLPRSEPSPIAISYIFTLHSQRGKFLPKKAIALGIKPGPDFSKLVAGETLTAADGTEVRPEDVMEPTRPGTGIAVCDLPDATYINDFLVQEEWKDVDRIKTEIGCFFWILGKGVTADERLRGFMKNMAHARHVVSSVDVCPNIITYKGAAKAATKLSLIDEGYFPLPHASNIAPSGDIEGIEPAMPGFAWQVEPKWELQRNGVEIFSVEKALEETEPEYSRLAEVVRKKNQEIPAKAPGDTPWEDVEVITLGTGSALPSKYRNVSATLVRVPGAGSVLFDCGEGTLGQLKRLYPPAELAKVLRDLRAIYISHLHADHHLGTVAVLRSWYEELYFSNGATTGEIMNIVAPSRFLVCLREYADVEEYGFSKIRFVSCEDILMNARERSFNTTASLLPEVLSSLLLVDIQTSPAIHCQGSFTTAWTWQNGFKLAYSGDTRPTHGFVEIGKDATVLLHEATFDDELSAEAIAKKHSTTSEALAAGRDMGAKGVILTHFSQRYPKFPILSAEGDGERLNVVLAFDLCRIRLGDIGRFAGFLPALRELYKDEEDEPVEEPEEEEEVVVVAVTSNQKKGKKEKKKKEEA